MQYNLITTGLESIENKKKNNFFFLGNFFLKFDKKILFQKKNRYISDYHWSDKNKFNKDF